VLPLEDNTFDRVWMLDVVEHLHAWQLEAALAEARRVLRPGGLLVIHTLPNRWALSVGYRLARLVWPHLPREPRSQYERWVHVNEQSVLSLRRALARSGFKARVWVECWTPAHARWQASRTFPDATRATAYPLLRRRWVARLVRALATTPLRLVIGNDILAVARP
jgi:SAM-dependent methyltransferase